MSTTTKLLLAAAAIFAVWKLTQKPKPAAATVATPSGVVTVAPTPAPLSNSSGIAANDLTLSNSVLHLAETGLTAGWNDLFGPSTTGAAQ